jgi:hypothetical protein
MTPPVGWAIFLTLEATETDPCAITGARDVDDGGKAEQAEDERGDGDHADAKVTAQGRLRIDDDRIFDVGGRDQRRCLIVHALSTPRAEEILM